ncbi:hypothetical protein Tco_0715751 [Tanacetum coccineum]
MTGAPAPPALLLSDKLMTFTNLTTRVPVLLDVDEMNYSSWMFFSYRGYDLLNHILGETKTTDDASSSELTPPTAKWLVVENPKMAKEAWDIIALISNDNKRSPSIALKAELRLMKLGDLSIDTYFSCSTNYLLLRLSVSLYSVVYVLTTPIPEDGGDDATVEQIRKMVKMWNLPRLQDFLEAKYMANDASSKKFPVSNFTNYKMIDSRPVMEQYNELLGILERFTQHKMNMNVAIQLGSHLCIEESLKVNDSNKPKGNNVAGPSVVFSTLMAFGGNTRDLGSFGEETDKITDLHQIHKEVLFTERGDGVAGIKRRRHDLSSDDVRDLATASGRGRT